MNDDWQRGRFENFESDHQYESNLESDVPVRFEIELNHEASQVPKFNVPVGTLQVILKMIFTANLFTDTVHSAFSTNHLTDIYKTKHNYDLQQHKNLNKQIWKLLTYEQTEPDETKDWFRGL